MSIMINNQLQSIKLMGHFVTLMNCKYELRLNENLNILFYN